jgi:hypothetical protein
MLEMLRFLRTIPGLSLAFGHLALATALLMTLATLGPGFVARVLGLGPADSGYILAPAGLGMLVATGLLGHFAAGADRHRLARWGLFAMAVSLAALALVRPAFDLLATGLSNAGPAALELGPRLGYLAVACLITFSLGVEFALVTIPAQTVVSEATEPSVRGRVFAALFMLTGAASSLPVLVIGALADNVGIVRILLGVAGAVALTALWSRPPRK